jgi:DNA-binding transcriptional MerR regulator/methylmalonyl-CoA mutase cobalamin-binding subunit
MSKTKPTSLAARAAKDGKPPGYSIRVAARLSGVSADKLRVWERRYGFPAPERTSTGQRVYGDPDVKRLALIAQAIEAGYRASQAIAASPKQLRRLIEESTSAPTLPAGANVDASAMLERLQDDDLDGFRNGLRQAVAVLGPERFVREFASPLIDVVGDAWQKGRIAVRHEHLFSAALTTQIRLLLAAFERSKGGPTVLLTTLPGERHGLGLELAALYLAVKGAVVRLLGVDTPLADILEATRALEADVLGISVSAAGNPKTTAADIQRLFRALPRSVALWVGGKAAQSLRLPSSRTMVVRDWDDVDRLVAPLLGRA